MRGSPAALKERCQLELGGWGGVNIQISALYQKPFRREEKLDADARKHLGLNGLFFFTLISQPVCGMSHDVM